MAEIILTKGEIALIDDIDLPLVKGYTWFNNCGYAQSHSSYYNFLMHQIIMETKNGEMVDHINGNGLDNRRSNLRIATKAQNGWNRSAPKSNTSGYKGVSRAKGGKKWRAYITVLHKRYSLGVFQYIKDAARAYNIAALKYHGEFARLNQI